MSDTISAEEYNAIVKQEKQPKYRNVKQKRVWQGKEITLDSKAEARRFDELVLMQENGLISGLHLQPRYSLFAEGMRICFYVADFAYWDTEKNCEVVEDVKSKATMTPTYRIKKRLMLACHGIEIQEVLA